MRTTLVIEGMRCAGCAGNVEGALRHVKGVEGVQVSLENKRAIVMHASAVTPESLAATVNNIGYRANIAPGGQQEIRR
ncbi:MAG: heavy-metal-associated domain-containing protein [Phycisphaerales bacterium]|nr:heavy-metal-associated domain-containing protein [Phycisphaerales bacterium]